MKKTMILASFLALAPFAKGQLLLEALDAPDKQCTSSVSNFIPSDRCLELVCDKHYGDGVHNYIYCAVQGPNGKKWLNLNLGAEYAKESSPHFNPQALPTAYTDWKAFGNLYQWGRDSDGHEQVEYRQGSENWEFRPINGVRTTKLGVGEQSNQMVNDPNSNLYAEGLGETWINDPCPNGYHIATPQDIEGLGKIDIIQGQLISTSLFGTTRFPNLKLITSPVADVFEPLGIKSGWNVSWTTITKHGTTSGSSGLWLSGKLTEHRVFNYNNWEKFTFAHQFLGDPGALIRLDYYGNGGIYEITGVSKSFIKSGSDLTAIRCVQN